MLISRKVIWDKLACTNSLQNFSKLNLPDLLPLIYTILNPAGLGNITPSEISLSSTIIVESAFNNLMLVYKPNNTITMVRRIKNDICDKTKKEDA